MSIKPETRVVCLGLIRREKQRILGKPVDPDPNFSLEVRLLAMDNASQDLLDDMKDEVTP